MDVSLIEEMLFFCEEIFPYVKTLHSLYFGSYFNKIYFNFEVERVNQVSLRFVFTGAYLLFYRNNLLPLSAGMIERKHVCFFCLCVTFSCTLRIAFMIEYKKTDIQLSLHSPL